MTSEPAAGDSGCPAHLRLPKLVAIIILTAGFIAALYSLIFQGLWMQAAAPRTGPGVAAIALGLSPPLLRWLLTQRIRKRPPKSAAAIWAFVGLYAIVQLGLYDQSLRSNRVLLPRPFAPIVVVRVDADANPPRTIVEFVGRWKRHLTGGCNQLDAPPGQSRFEATLWQPFAMHRPRPTIIVHGAAEYLSTGEVTIDLTIDARDRFELRVEGITAPVVEPNDHANDKSFPAGVHHLGIDGGGQSSQVR